MSILDLVREILVKISILLDGLIKSPNTKKLKGEIMYVVKADNPDVGFNVSFTVTDSEGNVIPSDSMAVVVTSDNEDSVALTLDETGRSGNVHFGNPGLANVNVTVNDVDGDLLGSFGAQFTVTVGDPSAISGGTLVFEGLSEV